ncbi:hypothetical protein [Aquipseudomonas campi]
MVEVTRAHLAGLQLAVAVSEEYCVDHAYQAALIGMIAQANAGQEELTAADTRWRESLQLLRDMAMYGEEAIDKCNGKSVKKKVREFLAQHGGQD